MCSADGSGIVTRDPRRSAVYSGFHTIQSRVLTPDTEIVTETEPRPSVEDRGKKRHLWLFFTQLSAARCLQPTVRVETSEEFLYSR